VSGRRTFGNARRLPSGRWQASYWHEGRRHVASRTFPSKGTANAYLAAVEADVRRGAWVDPRAGEETFGVYANNWLEERRGLSPKTAERYRSVLDRHLLPTFGESTLAKLTPSKVRAWHAELAGRLPGTAAKAYRLLSSIMSTAVRDGAILRSPCQVVGGGSERSAERPVATVAEIGELTVAMPERLRAAVLLAAWCQLRRGELLALRRRDIDLEHQVLRVARSFVYLQDGSIVAKEPKTDRGRRTLVIPGNIVGALRWHLDEFVRADTDALVFTGEKGGPLRPNVLQHAWAQARRSVGRPELRLHALRHTGLTLLAAQGATLAELMHRAGHASPAAALRYQHATVERDRVLAKALACLDRSPAPSTSRDS
jgi:integrase